MFAWVRWIGPSLVPAVLVLAAVYFGDRRREPLPLVLLAHDGPWSRDSYGFDATHQWLANRGYDPAYGARPLKRVIQKHVQDPLAEAILAGRIKDGDVVRIGVVGDELVFNGVAAKSSKQLMGERPAQLH